MSVARLLQEFQSVPSLPISLNEVVEWVKQRGFQDEIHFIGVDLDDGVLRGFVRRFTYRKTAYGEPIRCAHIYYARSMTPEWKNLVIAKELIHCVQPYAQMTTKQQVDRLISQLTLPAHLRDALGDPQQMQVDELGEPMAAALLLPLELRELLLLELEQGRMTEQNISQMALLPIQHVRMVLAPEWPNLVQRIMEGPL